MSPIQCANAPSAAKLFVQLYARRSVSSLAATSISGSILDVLLPPRTQAQALRLAGLRGNAAITRAAPMCSRTNTNTSIRRDMGVSKKTFSTSRPLQRTLAIHNPQTDDEGNEMALEITPRAANRLSQIMSKDQNPSLALRIQVESGGCHGFQYLMSLTTLPPSLSSTSAPEPLPPSGPATEDLAPSTTTSENPTPSTLNEDDTIFVFAPDTAAESHDSSALLKSPKIILDLPSLELLKGSKVDYTMELIGSQFKIVDNPLATSSCGCGTSFDIKI
ncbi:hypothetical protein F5Y19DRAFT_121241 [Xylariaceae sp. FL1651]|nr:hypothetical protein F5Y19DRAFT_121241 [Xylariaceae sp. FL1651]